MQKGGSGTLVLHKITRSNRENPINHNTYQQLEGLAPVRAITKNSSFLNFMTAVVTVILQL